VGRSPDARAGKGRRRWLPWVIGLVTVLAVAVIAGGVAVVQNDYDIDEQSVSIPFGPIALDGVLATPPGGQPPLGLVVFVHGDGPIDATYDSFYRPIWESFARAGYASLSWNKQGIDGSAGTVIHHHMVEKRLAADCQVGAIARRIEVGEGRILANAVDNVLGNQGHSWSHSGPFSALSRRYPSDSAALKKGSANQGSESGGGRWAPMDASARWR